MSYSDYYRDDPYRGRRPSSHRYSYWGPRSEYHEVRRSAAPVPVQEQNWSNNQEDQEDIERRRRQAWERKQRHAQLEAVRLREQRERERERERVRVRDRARSGQPHLGHLQHYQDLQARIEAGARYVPGDASKPTAGANLHPRPSSPPPPPPPSHNNSRRRASPSDHRHPPRIEVLEIPLDRLRPRPEAAGTQSPNVSRPRDLSPARGSNNPPRPAPPTVRFEPVPEEPRGYGKYEPSNRRSSSHNAQDNANAPDSSGRTSEQLERTLREILALKDAMLVMQSDFSTIQDDLDAGLDGIGALNRVVRQLGEDIVRLGHLQPRQMPVPGMPEHYFHFDHPRQAPHLPSTAWSSTDGMSASLLTELGKMKISELLDQQRTRDLSWLYSGAQKLGTGTSTSTDTFQDRNHINPTEQHPLSQSTLNEEFRELQRLLAKIQLQLSARARDHTKTTGPLRVVDDVHVAEMGFQHDVSPEHYSYEGRSPSRPKSRQAYASSVVDSEDEFEYRGQRASPIPPHSRSRGEMSHAVVPRYRDSRYDRHER